MQIPRHVQEIIAGVLRPLGFSLEDLRADEDITTLSVQEACDLLRCGRGVLYRLEAEGRITAIKLGAHRRCRKLYMKNDVVKFLRESAKVK